MKYSLKKEYKKLYELDARPSGLSYPDNKIMNPIATYVGDEPQTSNDFKTDRVFPDRLSSMINSFLNNKNTITLKLDNASFNEVVVVNKQIFDLYFVLLREGIESLQGNSRFSNILNESGHISPKDFSSEFFDLNNKPGGGDYLLINVINSNTAKEFLLNIIVLLYRKVVEKKNMTPRLDLDSNLEKNIHLALENYLDKVVDIFKDSIIENQSGLSTTFGTTFEVIASNRIKEKLSNHTEPDWSPREVGIDRKFLASNDIEIASKKATLLILLIIKNKFNSSNQFYKKLIDKNNVLSNDFWIDCFSEVFEDVGTQAFEKLDTIIEKYTGFLGHKSLGEIECLEYEDDSFLKKGANNNPEIVIPTAHAYFDFIIRTHRSLAAKSDINIGLFDLKCTNKNVETQPIDTGSTGNNKSNSAIKNIYNTTQALQSLTKNQANACFIGLVQAEYQLVLNSSSNNIDIEILDVRDIYNNPKDVISNNDNRDKLNIKSNAYQGSRTHVNPDPSTLSNDFINSKNTRGFTVNANDGKVINFGKIIPELEKIFNFLKVLMDCEYKGDFSSDISNSNYLTMFKNSFLNVEEFYKIKKYSTTVKDIIEENYAEDPEFEKDEYFDIINKVVNDNSYDLKKIVKDSIYALSFNEKNYIYHILPTKKQTGKNNISLYILSLFGGNNKVENFKIYYSIDGINTIFPNRPRSPADFQFSYQGKNKKIDTVNAIIKPILYKLEEKEKFAKVSLNASTDDEVTKWRDEAKMRGSLSKDALLSRGIKVEHKLVFGNILKEVYSHLFKKKLISEGGLAGHMMHPYEALDMTPRQIVNRIKEYSISQSIIEKVDGQNLFFTVEQDGTLMFARNKEDMTHDDLVAKFTGHGAELPFVEGGNAIKRSVEQWLQSAGPAAEMEIREIFHPDGETKSFINFEIMHPDKPNQIVYDEKYVVLHSIVDFVNGRETTYSTNKGQRLEKLIKLMTPGITSSGFTLASNRTVSLNQLTNVQIKDYVDRIKEVTQQLGISENEFLGDGIEKQIKLEIEREGIKISDEAASLIYDFVLYGETKSGNNIKSRDFTSMLSKEDATKLRSIGLTSAANALKKVQRIISPFKEIFVDLGIDLLQGVKSAYMSDETNQININMLKDKLQTAVDDLVNYMNETPEEYWEDGVHRLRPHLDKVIDTDINSIVSTAVEGGVYDNQGDLLKVTGGFAPLNQILGAAYRDKKGIFPTFRQKFIQQESNRRSLKDVFNLIY